MSYEELWKTLADLIKELRIRGRTVPSEVVKDLRSAKTLIQILKADPSRMGDIVFKIEKYLGDVQSYLIFTAGKELGREYFDRWMRRLAEAKRNASEEKEDDSIRFVPNLPRDNKWIRIKVSKENPREIIENIAKERDLSCRMQENGYMLVHGERERIKAFVKKMAGMLRSERGR